MGLFEAMRENTKVILWITVIAFVGLIFLAWGANFSTRSRGRNFEAGIMGTVNGEKIHRDAFSYALQQARMLYEQQLQTTPDEDFYLMLPARYMAESRVTAFIDGLLQTIRAVSEDLRPGYDLSDTGKIIPVRAGRKHTLKT